jgi:CBS domain-containing protein
MRSLQVEQAKIGGPEGGNQMSAQAVSGKASDVMNTKVISILVGTMLNEVVKLLAGKHIGGLPVVDETQRVVGMITEKDLVEYASKVHVVSFMDSSGWVSPHTSMGEKVTKKQGFELLKTTPVEKVMSHKVITVMPETAATEVARLMKKKKVNRIPVVDRNGVLCGIIARDDLINYLAGID